MLHHLSIRCWRAGFSARSATSSSSDELGKIAWRDPNCVRDPDVEQLSRGADLIDRLAEQRRSRWATSRTVNSCSANSKYRGTQGEQILAGRA